MLTNSDETSTPASAQPASTEAAVASAAGTGAGSNVPSSAGEVAPVVLDVAASSSVATSSSVVIEPASDDKTGAQPAVATAGSGALTSVSAPSPVVAPEVHAESMEKARDAYKKGDLAASAAAHEAKRGIKAATENHGGTGSEYIKSIVFGGIDGIATTIALAASMAGSDYSAGLVIAIGFAKLIGDAISMGVGDWLSESAEHKYIRGERRREQWEYQSYPEGEISEMVDIYVEKGFSRSDAEEVIRLMTKKKEYEAYFLDHMMVQELGQLVPEEDAQPWKDGLVSFLSFIVFGAVPLVAYVVTFLADYHSTGGQLGIACACTAVTLFLLGAVQAKIIRQVWWKQGLFMLINGGLSAGAAYAIGFGLEKAFGVSESNEC